MENNGQHHDIIIAGGGLSGLLSALSFATLRKKDNSVFSIAIIEANANENISATEINNKVNFDARVLALSHNSAHYLKKLFVWDDIANYATAIDKIHISDAGYYGKARMTAQEHQVDALGYVIELEILGNVLLKKLTKYTNITWYCPEQIENIRWQSDAVNIDLASSKKLQGKLLLACDGSQSICRQFAHISSYAKSYEQSALIANITTQKSHQHVAFERFTASGPIAVLPLADSTQASRKSAIVWTLPPQQADHIRQLDDEAFKQQFESSFGSWLGEVEKVGKRHVFPLSLVQAEEQVYHRMALIGNASHTIHPIAGQGFNLGLRDIQQLRDMVENQLFNPRQLNEDLFSFSLLMQYATQRKTDHQNIIKLTDSLVTLFSNDIAPLVLGRNIGLKVLNYLTPLKNIFVDKTMGY